MRAETDIVVGAVRRTGWTRVGYGLYRRTGTETDRVDAAGGLRADLLAWQQVLPPSGCLTHLTAAVLHDLWLPPVPTQLPVFVSMAKEETRPKRPQLVVMRHTRPVRTTRRHGLTCATVEELLLSCARDLALLDLVVLGDSALHKGLTTPTDLRLAASRRRWGAGTLMNAIGWMDARSESPWESLLRVLHRACGSRLSRSTRSSAATAGSWRAATSGWSAAACCTSTTAPFTATVVPIVRTWRATGGCWRPAGTVVATSPRTC